MFGGIAPGDWRPDDWFSFAESSGQIAETIAAAFQAFGPTAPPQAFGIAPGEDIGIRDYTLPTLGTRMPGSGQATVSYQPIFAGPGLHNVVSIGTGPGAFEEGGVFAGPSPEWTYEGEPWDPYDTPEMPKFDDVERREPILIPLDASGGEELEPEDESMPSFWDYASGVVDVLQGQQVGGAAPVSLLPPAVNVPTGVGPGGLSATPPAGYYVNSRGFLCRKRRRRRRLLTESDFNDLMRIATLPNKQNVAVALAKAVGRR